MPFIQTKVSVKLSKQQEESIRAKFASAASNCMSKPEAYLMCSFEDECSLYFRDNNNGVAFVEIKLFGSASKSAYNKMTAEVTKILNQELNIDTDKIYITYQEIENWGWNGNNF